MKSTLGKPSNNIFIKNLLNVILVIQALLVLYPIAFTISSAFTKSNSLSSTSILPWPTHPSLYQFQRLLTPSDQLVKGTTDVHGTNYVVWFLNTLKIAVMNT